MRRIPLLLSSLFFVTFLVAQDGEYKMNYTIDSKAFGDERKITVYLPPSYYESPEDTFTVTYVLDGHFDPFIDLVVKTIEYNTYMLNYTSTIVVGVHAKARGWEFSASVGDEDDLNYEGGRAPELQQHFDQEIFPFVDSLGLKINSFRSIIGHSSGGTFVLYTLFGGKQDLFDAYICISPAIREDSEYVLDQAASRLGNQEQFNKFLYCSSGTVGEREEIFGNGIKRLDSLLDKHPDNGLLWQPATFQGMDHWTCVPPSINDAMVELTRAFRVDEKMLDDFSQNKDVSVTDQINDFYDSREQKYGFIEKPYPKHMAYSAWEIFEKGRKDQALEILEWGIQEYPNHYTLRNYQAHTYKTMGKLSEAHQAYLKLQELIESQKDSLSKEKYESRMKRVKENITKTKM